MRASQNVGIANVTIVSSRIPWSPRRLRRVAEMIPSGTAMTSATKTDARIR